MVGTTCCLTASKCKTCSDSKDDCLTCDTDYEVKSGKCEKKGGAGGSGSGSGSSTNSTNTTST